MNNNHDFTEGEILRPMLTFRGPVLLAMFLQSLYGAVDLMVVGKFAEAADASGVNTGSQAMMMLTFVVTSFSMAVTILMGQHIGEKSPEKAGDVIGTGYNYVCGYGSSNDLCRRYICPRNSRRFKGTTGRI